MGKASALNVNGRTYDLSTFSLIWENESPTSSMGATTIDIPQCSDFDMFLVVIRNTTSSAYYSSGVCLKGDASRVSFLTTNARVFRTFTFSDSGASVTTGYSNSTQGNTYAIPYRVYGIR